MNFRSRVCCVGWNKLNICFFLFFFWDVGSVRVMGEGSRLGNVVLCVLDLEFLGAFNLSFGFVLWCLLEILC